MDHYGSLLADISDSPSAKKARTTGPLDPWRTKRPWHSPAPAAVGTSEKMATRGPGFPWRH